MIQPTSLERFRTPNCIDQGSQRIQTWSVSASSWECRSVQILNTW